MNSQSTPFADLKGGRLLIAALVLALANFMVVLDTTIANVSLPHITGSLAVSSTQGTWVITSYAVAEAICVPLTGWLAGRFGVVRTFVACVIGFTVFSVLCGLSNSLALLVICRIGQGLFGGPIMPLSQTLLMRIFPQEKHAQAMGLWAMTTVIGPILGPILGGTISDNISWHWIFFINIPVGIICALGAVSLLKSAETPLNKLKIDHIGLILLVIWIGALQLMLDLGHEHDWFHSNLINSLAAVAIAGFIVFLIWEITEHNPIVNVRVFRHRGFTISVLALSFGFGAFFGSIVLIPQWLQINIGYTATWAGYVTATMGFGSLTMSPVVAKLSTRYDQRALACFGLLVLGGVTFMRALWTSEADFMALAIPQILQGFAVPFFFIPLSNIALASVLPQEIASAAGLMSFMRTMAGAIGASMSATMWDDHAKLARSEIVSSLNPEPTQHTLVQSGMSPEGALAMISNLVNKEALTLAADHVFLLFSLVFVVSGLIIWLCPKPKTGAATGPTH
ncbi:DHA2 family efflux MFS transporter permease subunit [Acinetobacter radioresistens]|uniref:DHA2 family efflux MFS transporter permease subunit n=1 Tax=Acinetobacter radioresistens TaxID=40216 RepID=UPI0009467FA0|nr:DHA2 family efflux MFS transporter permease subunit [Acinetobacter radioresistens]AWV87097.1 MFS transporter [Acinetobacter radioresistens]MCX0329101.1 DHA2 family efflux MFS transporter permease subunit [Acinetobacter radioresistens]